MARFGGCAPGRPSAPARSTPCNQPGGNGTPRTMNFWWVFMGFQWDLMWSRGFYGIIDIFFDFDGILVGVNLDLLGFDCFLNGNLIGYNYITFLILMEYWFVASGVLSCGCMGKSKRIISGIFQLAMFDYQRVKPLAPLKNIKQGQVFFTPIFLM